jgi:hypothetical protein
MRNCFHKIESEEDAYWFGYIMADGYNHKNGKVVQFTQAEQDKDMVYKLLDYIGRGSITISTFDNKLRQTLYMLSISSKTLSENLTNLGCLNCKSLTMKMPDIPKELYWHFIRGYFDGDGCIYCKLRPSDNSLVIECPIVCSNDFAEEFSKTLKEHNIQHYCQKLGKNKLCTTVKITGSLNNSKFLGLLYNNCSIYSPRKMDKFKFFCETIKNYNTTHKKTLQSKQILSDYGFID